MNTEKFEVIGEDVFVDKPVEPSQPAVTENPRVGVDHYDETPPAKAPEDKAKTQEKEVPPEKSTPPEKTGETVKAETEEDAKPFSLIGDNETEIPAETDILNDPTYKDKSLADVVKMHKEAVKKISEQGRELGELRTTAKEPSLEEIVSKMTSKDVLTAAAELRQKLADTDPVLDKENYDKLAGSIANLDAIYIEKKQEELFNEQLKSQHNRDFVEKQKKEMQELGILCDKKGVFSESEFNKITEHAQNFATKDGKLTDNSFFMALVDIYGSSKVSKFFELKGIESARKAMAAASTKEEKRIDTQKAPETSKSAQRIKFLEMSPRQRDQFLDSLTPEELDEFDKQIKSKLKG